MKKDKDSLASNVGEMLRGMKRKRKGEKVDGQRKFLGDLMESEVEVGHVTKKLKEMNINPHVDILE